MRGWFSRGGAGPRGPGSVTGGEGRVAGRVRRAAGPGGSGPVFLWGGAAMVSPGVSVRGRTRWRRFAVALVPALGVAGLLVVLTAQSLLAVSFSLSGTPFVVT